MIWFFLGANQLPSSQNNSYIYRGPVIWKHELSISHLCQTYLCCVKHCYLLPLILSSIITYACASIWDDRNGWITYTNADYQIYSIQRNVSTNLEDMLWLHIPKLNKIIRTRFSLGCSFICLTWSTSAWQDRRICSQDIRFCQCSWMINV